MTEERKKTKNGEVFIDGEILIIKMFGQITAEQIAEIANAGIEMVKKSKDVKYNLIDISGVIRAPLSARQKASDYIGGVKKMAFVCSNPVARIIGSFFLRRYSFSMPVKMFSNTDEAKKWLTEGESG
jgi:hypothetical protein